MLVVASVVVWESRGPVIALAFAAIGGGMVAVSVGIARRHLWLAHARLRQARTAAERIAQGHFDSLPMEADEELAGLATAFNSMRDVMAARESALREETIALTVVNRRMEAVLDATDDGLALIDAAGYIVLVNRRFCEMMGLRRDSLLLHSVDDLKEQVGERFTHPEKMLRALTPNTDRAAGVVEDSIELAKEHSFYQLYTAPVRDDNREIAGQILALHDMTREKELDKMKSEFISVVSHELRTPLTSIKGYTDLLLSGATGELNEIQTEFLGILQGSATRLGNLINDILDISRIESGRLEVKQDPIDYSKIIADVLRLMKAAADDKDIMLDASLPERWPTVRGDADKITQIVSNLLSNAIKYTPMGGFVKILVDVTGDAGITTCVIDSGIGISTEDQKKLFQKFFRADNSLTREAGGTGLGLVIVKTMVELLGGTIWVESEVGSGSKFYFTLPLYSEGVEAALAMENRAASQATTDRGIGVIMVVDDDAFVRDQLQHTLHRRGYAVVPVDTTDEALPKAKLNRPNVVLLDMMLPDMGSYQIIRSLHSNPMTRNVSIVAYSLAGDPLHGQLALSAFSFMHKPIDAPALSTALKKHVAEERSPSILLIASEASPDDPQVLDLARSLRNDNVHCFTAPTPAQAITYLITEQVDAILIDIDRTSDSLLFEMMRTLKAEEDIARIPIVIVTEEVAADAIHFHLGSTSMDATMAIDYLVEQVIQVAK
jgi:PAS domain S-box-containing protein